MKTWQMIKELTENPEKEFTRKSDGLHIKTSKYGELVWDNGYQFLGLHHDWEEIKKPVDFMTAIKALNGGKVIYAIRADGHREVFNPAHAVDWVVTVEQSQGYAVDTETVLYGKWYIEED